MFFLVLAVVFAGCKKDEKEPVLDTNATILPTWVSSPAPDTHFCIGERFCRCIIDNFRMDRSCL